MEEDKSIEESNTDAAVSEDGPVLTKNEGTQDAGEVLTETDNTGKNGNETAEDSDEYVTVDAEDINKVIAEAVKKAGKKGAVKGSIITAVVILVLLFVCIVGYIVIRIFSGNIPTAALGMFSSGLIDKSVYDKAEGIYTVVENTYFNDVDKDTIREGIYHGMMEALGDPYSVYYTKEEFDEMMESSTGSFEGIGAYLQQDPDTLELSVSRPMKGSPSEEAGILAGDVIVTVDGEDISDQDINVIVSKIKGPAGTEVVLGIRRGDETFDVTVKRAVVHELSVDGQMLEGDGNIGYIYIASFEEDTANQFRDILNELKDEGMERLIIDLRDDGGGYVDICVEICDMLLPECNIVSTKDKHGITMNYDSSDDEFIRMPIVLLVNGNTASASEIMTAALRDNDYATVVGEKTFGKGIVQEVMQLEDGSGIKVTISEYFTPKGVCIQGEGITPDIELELDVDKYIDEGVDNQLEKAKEVILK